MAALRSMAAGRVYPGFTVPRVCTGGGGTLLVALPQSTNEIC